MTQPEKTAVLIMDYQNAIVENYSGGDAELLPSAVKVLSSARQANIPVIYVVIGFRPGFPEISKNNKSFSALRESGRFAFGDASTEIHSAVAPQANDLIVTKHRVSSFSGSDLEMLLRANEINKLVLMGIATSGVVLSTLRYAADLDFQITVLRDCCADQDAEVHQCLLEKVFPRQADVMTSDEWISQIDI
jgi:nicotinamidase-related amidase